MTVGLVAHIQAEVLDAGDVEIPFVKRFLVHRADVGEAFFLKVKSEVAPDKSAAAGDDDQIVLLQRRIFFHDPFRLFHIRYSLVELCGDKLHWTRREGNNDSLRAHDDY